MGPIESIRRTFPSHTATTGDPLFGEGHFRGDVARWRVPGVHGLARLHVLNVERARSANIAPLGMASVAVPSYWNEEDEYPVIPDLWFLREATVIGGAIIGRDRDFHWDGQVVSTRDHRLIPASFGVMDGNITLPRGLVEGSGTDCRVRPPDESPRWLDGTYVLLGSMHRHWGHAILEGLTRLWVKSRLSSPVKWLVYEAGVQPFAKDLLRLAGIPEGDVVHAGAHDKVERLIVPDIGMRSHRWITTAQTDSWSLIRSECNPSRRVYLSRSGVGLRKCVDEPEVEDIFRRAGWEVIRPESLSVAQQVSLAGECAQLAGLVGSQMYLAAFQPDRSRNVVVAPRNFFLRDDLLIGAARSHDLAVVFGGSVNATDPAREWRVDKQAMDQIREAAED